MQRPKEWDKYEAAVLLDAYLKILTSKSSYSRIVENTSNRLRMMAKNKGMSIDDIYRNKNGIMLQLCSMESAYLGYKKKLPATKLFTDVVRVYRENRKVYDEWLSEANATIQPQQNEDNTENQFKKWLLNIIPSKSLPDIDEIFKIVDEFCIQNDITQKSLTETVDKKTVKEVLELLEGDRKFRLQNKGRITKISLLIRYYYKFLEEKEPQINKDNGDLPLNDGIPRSTIVREEVCSSSNNTKPEEGFDKEAFIKVLMMRYKNGLQFDSIDLDNFRETYCDIIGDDLNVTDKELTQCLRKCGVFYEGRVFPAEGIINAGAQKKLMEYIANNFENGNPVLYYKAIFSDLADTLAYCYNLTDVAMLKLYLEYIYTSDEFYFADEYMAKEKNIKVDHTAEVEDYMLSMGKPLSYEEVYAGLSHISRDVIYGAIKSSPNIILNGKGYYFHYGIFEFSSEDADQISGYISENIEEDEYCIWSHVYAKIRESMPLFIENNVYLSPIGLRNAVAKKLSGRFNFDSEVICAYGKSLSMSDVYRLYGEHHTPFSDSELHDFSREVSGNVIYFESLSKYAVRVSRNLFVSKDKITFDIEAVDNALSTYLSTGYMLIKDIDSFLVFPNVGYEWNEFLLESYLMYYSKKYALLNNGRSLNNVAGAVIRKGGGYDDFVDICADALAKSDCTLTKNKALEYLAEVNLITRRSYIKIDNAIAKARQIRNRKE